LYNAHIWRCRNNMGAKNSVPIAVLTQNLEEWIIDVSRKTITTTGQFKCRSLKCRSMITNKTGRSEDGDFYIRVIESSGGGTCNSQWFSVSMLKKKLQKHDERIWSGTFEEIFRKKCNNTSSFLLAALCHEGILVFRIDRDPKKTRSPYWLMLSSTAERATREHNNLPVIHE
jgi:hypothetical protein